MDVCDEASPVSTSTASTAVKPAACNDASSSPLRTSLQDGCDNCTNRVCIGGSNVPQTSTAVIDSDSNVHQISPCPRHISEQELNILQVSLVIISWLVLTLNIWLKKVIIAFMFYIISLKNCLSRWREEVVQDISELESSINDIDHKIESMYLEQSLRKLEYQLHAVMVHEGGVDSGHYWAYVKDHKKQVIGI